MFTSSLFELNAALLYSFFPLSVYLNMLFPETDEFSAVKKTP